MAIAQPITPLDVAKLLMENAQYLASGLGFTVTYDFKNTIGLPGNKGTCVEGIRELMKVQGMIMAALHIDPRSIIPLPESKKLIVPGG